MAIELTEIGLLASLCLVGSFLGLSGGLILLWKVYIAKRLSFFFISFATGALLGTAFFDLIPESLELMEPNTVLVWIVLLTGLLLFSITERLLVWHTHHEDHFKEHPKSKVKTYGPLLLIGDTIHNFIDGVIIAAAVLINVPLGIITAIAVLFHEIPQEIGDFAALLYVGYSRNKVILYNILTAAATFAGAFGLLAFADLLHVRLPLLLAFAAGGFIYIAASDLLPELRHEAKKLSHVIAQTAILITGIAIMIVLSLAFHV
ncbi:MAG: ZIP family metal transporter [Candidatus Nanoarchaeia archaeon]